MLQYPHQIPPWIGMAPYQLHYPQQKYPPQAQPRAQIDHPTDRPDNWTMRPDRSMFDGLLVGSPQQFQLTPSLVMVGVEIQIRPKNQATK